MPLPRYPVSSHRQSWVHSLSLVAFFLFGCAGSKVVAPEDMPEICQDIDFNVDANLREICNVKTRNYMAYRNIPEHRNLLQPKGGKIVRKPAGMELRLQNTLPTPLPTEFQGNIHFEEKFRRNFIKSKMDYSEFFPDNSTDRVKIIRLEIPWDTGGVGVFCYTLETKASTALRNTGYASRLEPMECQEFQRLKEKGSGS